MPDGSRLPVSIHARLRLVTLGASALRVEAAPNHGREPAESDAPVGAPVNALGVEPARDSTVTVFDLGKPLALITYLCCAPERSAPREHLIDLLWGDVGPEAAKHALRQTLWYIRKRLGDFTLISGGDVLTVVGAVDCDRDHFLSAVRVGDAEVVVRLYRGDFFPGFAAPGGVEFERWADIERQRLRSFFWRSAEVLVRRWMSAGRLREAQSLARRVRDSDVLRESGWRLLFETLIAASDTVGGAIEAEAFDRLIEAEGVKPEPATRALLGEVRQTGAAARESEVAQPASLFAELVGREKEFARLLASWDSARAGKPTHVHVLAPAGLGKTRLLTDVHARLRATRARTLFVRASLGARDIPFGLAGDLAEALARLPGASGISTGSARALVALNPALSASYPAAVPDVAGDPADALRRRTVAVRELVMAVAEEQPIAIFVDDVQWADARSRQLLASVLGGLEHARVLAVTASRPTVDGLTSAEGALTIRLAPLDPTGVHALVASIAELPSESWAERLPHELCNASGGSPLLVLETLQLAIEGGALERGERAWSAPRPAWLFAALGAGGALRQRVERLDRVERWVMTLLAVAAIPLTRDALTAASGRTDDEIASALGGLERRGLVARNGELWSPSHDEIAAMAVDLATADARRAAGRSLGRVILDRQSGDVRELRHAGSLLAQAEDYESLSVAFTRFAYAARRSGDRQRNLSLAYDFLGERASLDLIGRLVRSLPLLQQVGLYSVARQAVIVGMVALVPLGFLVNAIIGRRPPPDIELAIGAVGADSVARLYRVPIRGADFVVGSAIRISVGRRPAWTFHADPSLGSAIRNPVRASWAVDRVAQDAGGIDLFDVSDDGPERRLTSAVGDDQGATWSPDGRFIAYFTARWSVESRYDIAIQDTRTGAVRRLTNTDDSDTAPYWSPDGGRIVFERFYWGRRRREACVVRVDGSGLHCFGTPLGDYSPVGGWSDSQHVLLFATSMNRRVLARLDVESGVLDTIAVVGDEPTWVSPDGRWVACRCRRTGFAPGAILLFSVDEPNRLAQVDTSAFGGGRLLISWVDTRHANGWVDHLTIDSGLGDPVVGVPHLLTVRGASVTGSPVPVGPIQWRSLDTAVAVIDDHGIMVPRRRGIALIEAALPGWRATQQRLVVRSPTSEVVFREDWAAGIGPSWMPFGDPRPRIDSAEDGTPGFLNGGDGSFVSGAYTKGRFPTSRGLRLDGWISVTISFDHWQVVSVALEDGLDDVGLQRWPHRYGNIPRRSDDWPLCSAVFPGGPEGVAFGDSVSGTAGTASTRASLAAPPSFRRGAWFQVRLQIFPDGRCGVALNGVPIVLSSSRAIPDSSVRVVVHGNSVRSKVLVGPLVVQTGVASDIDWSRLGEAVPNAPPAGQLPMRPSSSTSTQRYRP